MKRFKLMIPGPVELDEDTLSEMSRPVVAHYGADWVKVYNETVDCLKQVFRTKGDLFIIVGSGSAGLDASVNSLLGKGDRAILAVNGFFGERLKEIARSYGVAVVLVEAEWGEPVTGEMIEEAARKNPGLKAVIVVHNETSTGVVNPIQEIGEVSAGYDLALIVDSITSIGGCEFDMDGWGVDIAVCASQKCLATPAGLAMVAVSAKAWRIMERRKNPPWGWYLNLLNWRDYREKWKNWHPYPITMATSNVLALRKSLQGLLEEGVDNRIKRHREAAQMLRHGIRKIGLKLVADDEVASSTVTAVESPPGRTSGELLDFLRNRYSIQIAGGMGKTKDRWFRIGHMGPMGTAPEAIGKVLAGIEAFMKNKM